LVLRWEHGCCLLRQALMFTLLAVRTLEHRVGIVRREEVAVILAVTSLLGHVANHGC
jgi:hypothetical protein